MGSAILSSVTMEEFEEGISATMFAVVGSDIEGMKKIER